MDARIAAIHKQLESLDCSSILSGHKPASDTTEALQVGCGIYKGHRDDFLQRLRTFRANTWFAKPDTLSPLVCASRGWCNTGSDLLTCEFCGRKIVCKLPANPAARRAAAARFTEFLISSHDSSCPWTRRPLDPLQLIFPPMASSQMLSGLQQRIAALNSLDHLPPVSLQAPAALLASIQPYFSAPPTSLPAAALCQVLVHILQLSQKQLGAASRAQDASVDASSGASSCTTGASPAPQAAAAASSTRVLLHPHQSAALLALLGWEVQLLLRDSNAGSSPAAAPPPTTILPHLITHAPTPDRQHRQQQQQPAADTHQQLPAVNCSLHCSLCGSRKPLWDFLKSGPLFLQTLKRQAALQAVLQEGRPAVPLPAAHMPLPPPPPAAAAAAAAPQAEAAQAAAAAAGRARSGTPDLLSVHQHRLPPLPPGAIHRSDPGVLSSPPLAAGAGGALGGEDSRTSSPAAPGQPNSRSSNTAAVAVALHQTIAGGALVSPCCSPGATAGPFGAPAAQAAAAAADGGAAAAAGPVFGLAALAAKEVLVRQRSEPLSRQGSPGVTSDAAAGDTGDRLGKRTWDNLQQLGVVAAAGGLDEGHGDPVVAAAAADSSSTGTAPKRQRTSQERPDQVAAAAVASGQGEVGVGSAKQSRRSFSPLASRTVQAALGLQDAQGPLEVPASALLQQPSLVGPATAAPVAGGAGVDTGEAAAAVFDPVGAHRDWCPWVAISGGCSSSSSVQAALEQLSAAAAAGLTTSSSSSSSRDAVVELAAKPTSPGWLQVLAAYLQQEQQHGAGVGPGLLGGSGMPGGGSTGKEDSSAADVMDRARWVLQALSDV